MSDHTGTESSVVLCDGGVRVVVDAHAGGRLSSLSFDDVEFLVPHSPARDSLGWGMYPMVPFAGRIRDGIVRIDGAEYQLRRNAVPHSIHGTVFDTAWTITSVSSRSCVLETTLGDNWPVEGVVHHRVEASEAGVRCTLQVTPTSAEMPVQVGWHPWFAPGATVTADFAAMLVRDPDGITTHERVHRRAVDVDDCFVGPRHPPRVTMAHVTVELRSDCSHWVVYDQSADGTCVEPQSGAPNAPNDDPVIVRPGETLSRWFEIVRRGTVTR